MTDQTNLPEVGEPQPCPVCKSGTPNPSCKSCGWLYRPKQSDESSTP